MVSSIRSHSLCQNNGRNVLAWTRRNITDIEVQTFFSVGSKVSHEIGGSRTQSLDKQCTESKKLEVHCKVSRVSEDSECCVICWIWSTVISRVNTGRKCKITSCFLQLTGFSQLISFFQQDLALAHTAQSSKSC